MSPAQRAAVQQAYTLLGEHFDRVLIVVDYEVDDAAAPGCTASAGYWHGGYMAAIGMANYAIDRILTQRGKPDEEPS